MITRQGSITDADREFVETWENISPSMNDVIRLDKRGDEVHEFISGRRNFMITSEERLITQDRILEESNDPFLNGSFRPVIVPDSVDVKSNPNALSDEEITSVLVSSQLAWDGWMEVLDAPNTLQRILDVADANEDLDISLKRYKQIEARLAEVKPKTQVTQKDRDQYEAMGGSSNTGGSARRAAATKTA